MLKVECNSPSPTDPQDFTIRGFGTHWDTEGCLYFFRDVIFSLFGGF